MIVAIYTAKQAHQAAAARRDARWDDPELAKLGGASLSLDLDIQRIYTHTVLSAEYINYTRRYVELQKTKESRDTEEFTTMINRMDDLWKVLSPPEEKALQSIDLNWFVEHPDADYAILMEIPPIFRPQIRFVDKEDPFQPITPRIFEDHNFSSKRSEHENRAIRLIHEAYVIMSCNDPGQVLIPQLKAFLHDFGVPFEDQQVFHGEDS